MPNEESYLNESLRKIAKGAGISFIGMAIGTLLGFLSRILLARWLGVSDYGVISLGIAALSIASTLGMVGMAAGVTRYVSFYRAKGDKGGIKGTIVSALKISFPISLALAALLYFGSDWISIYIFHAPKLSPVLKIFALALPFLTSATLFLSATIGFEDMRYVVYVEHLMQNALRLPMILILVVGLGLGVLGGALGWIFGIFAMPFLAFYFLEKRVFPVFNTNVRAVPMVRELFFFSIPLIFAGFSSLIMSWTDTLMLGFFLSPLDVGIYNAALPATRVMRMVLTSFGAILMPVIAGLYSLGRFEDIRSSYSAITKWILSISLPLFLVMFLFAEPAIRILFGSEYIAGATALRILAFGFFIFTLLGLSAWIVIAFGRTKLNMVSYFAGAGANFALNLFLIPLYGINGAAIATAFSFTLMMSLNFLFAYHIGKMQPFRLNHIKIFAASGIAVLVIYGVTKFFFEHAPLHVLVLMFLIFLVLYFFLLLVFKSFEEEDLMIMRAIDQRLGMKTDWIRSLIRRFL